MEGNLSTRIDMAIAYLKKERIIRFQKDVAERMGVDVNTVSRAKNGGAYNAETFAMNFNAAFDFIFSSEWLIKGVGNMLAMQPNGIGVELKTKDSVVQIPSWADSLINLVSSNTKAIETMRSENAKLQATLSAALDENKKLREEIKMLRIEVIKATTNGRKHAIYDIVQEKLPKAAEQINNNID